MITEGIINNSFIESNLTSIVPSSILIDGKANIVSVSKEVCSLLHYGLQEIHDESILNVLLTKDKQLSMAFDAMKVNGFFKSKKIVVYDKYKNPVEVEISGFYLGILSDFTDYVLLGIRDVNALKNYERLLLEKSNDFNELVYRTYHDLKGPAATIKGLVNISNYYEDVDEYKKLFNLIDKTNNVLSERLSNISMIFDPNTNNDTVRKNKRTPNIESIVRKIIGEKIDSTNVELVVNNSSINAPVIGMEIFGKMIRYALLGFLSMHTPQEQHAKISLTLESDYDNFQFSFEFTNFSGNSSFFVDAIHVRQNLAHLINEENAINFYLLRDLIHNYNGTFIPLFDNKNTMGFKIKIKAN